MSDKTKCKNTVLIDRLKELIDRETRERIAAGIGCDTSLVTKHYNEDRPVTMEYLVKYADYFGVSTDYLLGKAKDSTTDPYVQAACEKTGLSQEAIEKLYNIVAIMNRAKEPQNMEANGFLYRRIYGQNKTLLDFLDYLIRSSETQSFSSNLWEATVNGRKAIEKYNNLSMDELLEAIADPHTNSQLFRLYLFESKDYLSNVLDGFFKSIEINRDKIEEAANEYSKRLLEEYVKDHSSEEKDGNDN